MLLIIQFAKMVGCSDDGHISPPMKAIKFCSPCGVSVIRCDNINHLNECTVASKIQYSTISAIFHDVAAHCSLFPLQGVDLLLANMKH